MEKIQDILQFFVAQVHAILGEEYAKIIVYGSYARGDYQEGSDIDIMILVKLSETDIRQKEDLIYDVAFDIQLNYGIEISVILKNLEQYEYWLGTLPFYNNIEEEGIVIDEYLEDCKERNMEPERPYKGTLRV